MESIVTFETRWKKRHEGEMKNVVEFLTELYGAFGEFRIAYSNKVPAVAIPSREEIERIFGKCSRDYKIERIKKQYGVNPHHCKTTILLPTEEAYRRYLLEGYEYLNELVRECKSSDRLMAVNEEIQLITENFKNMDLMYAHDIAHEVGHEVAHQKQPEITRYVDLKSVSEGIATGIGFLYLLNKVKNGSLEKEETLDFIENCIKQCGFYTKNDPHWLGVYMLDGFDPHADKSLDDMMDYLLKRVNLAMENPWKALHEIPRSSSARKK